MKNFDAIANNPKLTNKELQEIGLSKSGIKKIHVNIGTMVLFRESVFKRRIPGYFVESDNLKAYSN